jgi:sugar/nucleoside kinase (ribokinase family)
MKVAVYGNLIYDQILHIKHELIPGGSHDCAVSYRPGGIANFCRAAGTIDLLTIAVSSVGDDEAGKAILDERFSPSQHVSIDEGRPTSRAVVVIDRNGKERTGFVSWGACRHRRDWIPENAGWHHFMYLDRLNITPENLTNCQGILSADLIDSRSVASLGNLIVNLDYLIISEIKKQLVWTGPWPKRGIITHRPDGSTFHQKSGQKFVRVQEEPDLNVLGAGDYFAAFCIANLYKSGSPDLAQAHNLTAELLRRQT